MCVHKYQTNKQDLQIACKGTYSNLPAELLNSVSQGALPTSRECMGKTLLPVYGGNGDSSLYRILGKPCPNLEPLSYSNYRLTPGRIYHSRRQPLCTDEIQENRYKNPCTYFLVPEHYHCQSPTQISLQVLLRFCTPHHKLHHKHYVLLVGNSKNLVRSKDHHTVRHSSDLAGRGRCLCHASTPTLSDHEHIGR